MVAQSRACTSWPASRTTIGDRRIAASSAYRPVPAEGSEPVVIDALPPRSGDLCSYALRGDWLQQRPSNRAVPSRLLVLVASPRFWFDWYRWLSRPARGRRGGSMAKLRQNAPNRWTHEELSPLPAQPHKAIPTTPRVRCGKKGKRRAPRAPRSHVAPPSESHRRHMTIVLPPATWACDSKLFLWRQAQGAAQPVACRGATAAPGR